LFALVYVLGVSAMACGGGTAPAERSVVARIRVSAGGDIHNIAVTPNSVWRASVSAMNSAGDSLPGMYPIALTSRDTAVVTIGASNWMLAVGGGQTYVVGTLVLNGETFTDSLHVSVGVPVSSARKP